MASKRSKVDLFSQNGSEGKNIKLLEFCQYGRRKRIRLKIIFLLHVNLNLISLPAPPSVWDERESRRMDVRA